MGGQIINFGHGLVVLGLVDAPQLQHLAQNQRCAVLVVLQIAVGIVGRGVVGDGDQAGALGQIQLRQLLAEVVLGRRGHAVAALSQVNIVEVPLQNLLLGVSLVKVQGGKDLQNLPFYRHIVVLGGILDELLGDGGAALNIAAGEHEQHPLEGTLPVDAVVLPERLVLDGHGGVDQIIWDLLKVDQLAVFCSMEGQVLHIFPRSGILMINRTGLVHDEIGLQMGLRDDDRLDVDRGKAEQDSPRDHADQEEGAQHLPYRARNHRSRGRPPPLPAPVRIGALIGC